MRPNAVSTRTLVARAHSLLTENQTLLIRNATGSRRDAGGPFRVDGELWYQPIGFRWAQNFAEYNAAEPQRFLSYYKEAAGASALVLAQDGVSVP